MRINFFYVFVLFILFVILAGIMKEVRDTKQTEPEQYADSLATVSEAVEPKEATVEQMKPVSGDQKKAPLFSLENLEGNSVSLSDYRGKKVLLNMWATWCGPCRQEMPELVNIDETYSNEKLAVIGVNMTSQEFSVKDVRSFAKQYNVTYPILLDDDGEVMDKYRVIGLPTSFLIDEKGDVMREFRGIVTMEKIAQILRGEGSLL
jgi:peroxiredoxin